MPEKVIDAEVVVTSIVTCRRCGTKNRLHKSLARGRYRCGSCHSIISDPFRSPRFRWPRLPVSFTWALRRYLGYAALVALGALILYGVWSDHTEKRRKSYMRPATGSAYTWSPGQTAITVPLSRWLPNGTVLSSQLRNGYGRLRVDNGTAHAAVLKLVDESSGTSVATFYVGASDSFTLQGIHDGVFDVLFTLGTDWDSTAGRFTRDRMYSRFRSALTYATTPTPTGVQYVDFSLTLHTVPGGTARTAGIPEEVFLSK